MGSKGVKHRHSKHKRTHELRREAARERHESKSKADKTTPILVEEVSQPKSKRIRRKKDASQC